MAPKGFEYDIGFECTSEGMYESSLTIRFLRRVRVNIIRRAFMAPVTIGISGIFVSIKDIFAPLVNPFDCKRPLAAVVLSLLAIPSQAGDEAQHEFLVFPSVELFDNTSLDDGLLDSAGYIAIADFMYSYSGDRLRFLGEYVLSTDENEIERLKAGWLFGEQTMLWVGRFHQPSKY